MGILITLICLVIAGGIALVSLGCPPAFYSGISLIGIGILTLLLIGAWRLCFSSRNWEYRTSDDKTKWEQYFNHSEKKPNLWETSNQKEGMFYEINLKKEKKVTCFHFSCGETCKAPMETLVTFRDKNRVEVYRKRRKTEGNESSIGMRLEEPRRAQYIRIEIKEPEIYGEQITWRVEAVYIWIKMPFGLEYTIGKCILDRL